MKIKNNKIMENKDKNLMFLLVITMILGMGLTIYGIVHSSLLVIILGISGLVVSVLTFWQLLKNIIDDRD
jgi:hypothetical protein